MVRKSADAFEFIGVKLAKSRRWWELSGFEWEYLCKVRLYISSFNCYKGSHQAMRPFL